MVHVKWETDIKSGLDIFTQKKGYLLKQRRRKKVSRMWFVLANNCLYYYESESVCIEKSIFFFCLFFKM